MGGLLGMSFRVGRLFDIEIRVHILFLIWIGFELLQGGTSPMDLWFLGMLFGIVLVHEFGHCFGARSVGGHAEQILMWPLGGLAFAHAPMTPWAQFVTVAAGPLVNVIFCILSGLVLSIAAGGWVVPLSPFGGFGAAMMQLPEMWWYVAIFYRVNLWLLAFNLLPVYPLDGGQLLQVLLWPFLGLHRAMQIACQIGLAACVLGGLWSLSNGGGMLFFIAIFGGFTCYQRLQMLKYGMVVDERVRYAPIRRQNTRSWWSRTFGRHRPTAPSVEPENPNPGGWESKLEERRRQEAEVDRILQKVSEFGIQSLSYVERQTLERASRERQQRDREFERQTRL